MICFCSLLIHFRWMNLFCYRVTITMLVSAFWHGVHSGYYLSMLTVPFILVAEDLAKRKFRSLVRFCRKHDWWLESNFVIHLSFQNPFVFDVFAGFAKVQWFSYMGIAFSLLAMDLTLNYWTSIYFIGHVAIIIVYAVSWIFPGFKVKSSEWEFLYQPDALLAFQSYVLCSRYKHKDPRFRHVIVMQWTIFSQ